MWPLLGALQRQCLISSLRSGYNRGTELQRRQIWSRPSAPAAHCHAQLGPSKGLQSVRSGCFEARHAACRGADASLRNDLGRTPAEYAADYGNQELEELLSQAGTCMPHMRSASFWAKAC